VKNKKVLVRDRIKAIVDDGADLLEFGTTCGLGKGCLHVSELPYELPFDSVHNFYVDRIGIQLFSVTHYNGSFSHLNQKKSKTNLVDTFGSKSYTESYGKSHM
jgi:hypothetical protein